VLGEVNLGKYAIKKVPVGNDHPRLAGTPPDGRMQFAGDFLCG
jgi:hypothetical protein